MNTLFQSFFSSVIWNALESVVYYGLFFIHQIMLFTYMPQSEYGKSGALFAAVYFMVSIIDLGFEPIIALSLDRLTASKRSFRSFIWNNSIPSLCLIASLIIASLLIPLPFATSLSGLFFVLLIASEYIRRILKSLLQLFFHHKIASLCEAGMLIAYLAIVWGAYAIGYTLSLSLLFIPLFILSNIVVLLFAYTLYTKIYSTLAAEEPQATSTINTKTLRAFSFANAIAPQLFSSNFLVPFLAIHSGLDQAATFKLLSSFIHTFSVALHKIFGTSGKVLLAHSSQTNAIDRAFSILNTITHKVITYASVACAFMVFFTVQQSSWLPLLAWYAAITLIETITVAHDKLYPINHSIGILCSINIITIVSMIAAMYLSPVSLALLLTTTLIIRLMASIGVIGLARYLWNAPTPWNTGIACTISTSLAIYCIFYQLA